MKQIAIFLFISLLFAGCSPSQTYYKSLVYTDNIQEHLNIDLQYCDAVARGARPMFSPQLPQGSTTTYGTGIIVDNHGNIYNAMYTNKTTQPSNAYVNNMLINMTNTIRASEIYESVKTQCLSQKGWYQISKQEYDQSNEPPSSSPNNQNYYRNEGRAIVFTSDPPGANIYVTNSLGDILTDLQKTTPTIIEMPDNISVWYAECYKAILNRKESEVICRPQEVHREVNFKF